MVKIGLEIHIYPRTQSKLFCECASKTNSEPNVNICPICTGQPGSKPMGINKTALKRCVELSLMLNCSLKKSIIIKRKHYFYPDLPNNYQRTSSPIGVGGEFKGIKIKELHIEEDAGKYNLKEGLVDFNRSGIPLIEMVTKPQIKSPEEAKEFLSDLRSLLEYLNMTLKSSVFKVDTNISIGGERVEIKNINGIEGVKRALEKEIERQKSLIKNGKEVSVETRHFDEDSGKSLRLREKESISGYRYLPDPDIPQMEIPNNLISEINRNLPEDLFELRERLSNEYNLGQETIETITSDSELVALFEKLADRFDSESVANWIKNELIGELNYRGIDFSESSLDYGEIEKLLNKAFKGDITSQKSVQILRKLLDENVSLDEQLNIENISDEKLGETIDMILNENEEEVKKYKQGKEGVLNFFIGEVSKELSFKVSPQKISRKIRKRIKD